MVEYDFEKAKEEYKKLCYNNNTIQIFNKAWYWDLACAKVDDWRVITIKEDNRIVAAFPFKYVKENGLWYITNGFQVARGGIWFDYGNRNTNSKRESFVAKVVEEILNILPYYDVFSISFDSRFLDWHQFYYNGFNQTTFYSYVVKPQDVMSPNELINSFQKYRRKEIRQASELYIVDNDMQVEEFWEYLIEKLKERGKKASYSKEEFLKLFYGVMKHDSGTIYRARDTNGKTVAALGTVYDSMRTYTLFVAYDSYADVKVSARSYLDYLCMKDTINAGRIFDFEGSMIKGVAEYNSRFNAEKEPYFRIEKYSSKFKKKIFLNSIKNIVLNSVMKKGET